jgi:hypothetical protein
MSTRTVGVELSLEAVRFLGFPSRSGVLLTCTSYGYVHEQTLTDDIRRSGTSNLGLQHFLPGALRQIRPRSLIQPRKHLRKSDALSVLLSLIR